MSDEDWRRLIDAELTHDRPLAQAEVRHYHETLEEST